MIKHLIDLFFPKTCYACDGLLVANEQPICVICQHNLPYTNHLLTHENEAFKKFYGRLLVEHVSAMLYYRKKELVSQLIHKLKYKKTPAIGTVLGNWYIESIKQADALLDIDYIVPVPLHPKKLKQRGYNQVTTFCNAIATGINKPLITDLLHRNSYAKINQAKKNLLNRATIDQNTFGITGSDKYCNCHFLLIDDVLTTGATLEACGRALLQIEGARLSIVTIAFAE